MSDKIQDFDYSVDLLQALLWQYNDAEKLQSLLFQKNKWYKENVSDFWDNWYRDVFNLDTANDFGLTVWAKILNISFSVSEPPRSASNTFGFGNYYLNFFDSNFYPEKSGDFILNENQKRIVLKLRFFQIISRATIPEINQALSVIFKSKAYAIDIGDMSNEIVIITTQLTADIQFILSRYDLIPRPSTIGVRTITVTGREFGFAPYGNNFHNAFFAN
ncbi:Protein of uncharacterised function (DUF2612) [Campylobacter hyointestinalis subsp. hyointestinalis]|uniref:Protein of uncharacterized function (DUF2612) n=1 Tax=Campylobacter hyointestinalis subsp. hyointestinalis TaxID=91352 RepID=A0A9W5ALA4_CAMHY|nr:DUF2612 domain-containing protein [Campylobacter hyointestinalis]CUU68189.1 Protein of uncharacterised function (DUF2612) [Campylobacter hyointestinalis subsp. hyointestinalis]